MGETRNMSLKNQIETERLKLRFLDDSDLNDVYHQFSDPEMCQYFSEPPCDMTEAKEIIDHYKNPEGKGYLRYGLFDKQTDAFIGTCGYHYLDRDKNQVEIGYDIWKDYWRQGYASEVLPILLQVCFDELEVDCIYVLVDPKNEASIATVRKFGFKDCDFCREPDTEQTICMKLIK
jgi:ribosomal-protein-alanine N-acetyltransferase